MITLVDFYITWAISQQFNYKDSKPVSGFFVSVELQLFIFLFYFLVTSVSLQRLKTYLDASILSLLSTANKCTWEIFNQTILIKYNLKWNMSWF